MEVEQMMACLLAEIRTNREKMDANQAKNGLTPQKDGCQPKKIRSNQEWTIAKMDA
jgi:hypothetical protein